MEASKHKNCIHDLRVTCKYCSTTTCVCRNCTCICEKDASSYGECSGSIKLYRCGHCNYPSYLLCDNHAANDAMKSLNCVVCGNCYCWHCSGCCAKCGIIYCSCTVTDCTICGGEIAM